MESSVESVCNLLARSRLLSSDDVRGLHQRWRGHAKDQATDIKRFSQWLVAQRYVTQYQMDTLLRGHADHFFLGQYKLLERIGKGRMAGVYKAIHQLGQTVAIKVLPPSKAKDPEIFGRFQREARLASRLNHPNLVRTYQMGHDDNLFYIVMEYLEGDTLEEVLQRCPKLPLTEAVRIAHQALLGLQHIHEQGIIHRDLKPGNLMLVPSPADSTLDSTVKIMDIGLGRALFDEGAPGSAQQDLTSEGTILGTPEYLAPEQARNAHQADIRADIYSLGCVLYCALAGRPPFSDVNLVRLMVRHANEAARPIKEFNPSVPDGLQQVINWMMAKDPAQRYPTPDRAAQALAVFLAATSEPVPAKPAPQMQAYLSWLEENTQELLSNAAEPQVGQPVQRGAERANPTVPMAQLLTQAASGLPESGAGSSADVELFAMTPTAAAAKKKSKAREAMNLTRRDYILLGIGAVGVLLAEGIGLLLGQLFRRKVRESGDGSNQE